MQHEGKLVIVRALQHAARACHNHITYHLKLVLRTIQHACCNMQPVGAQVKHLAPQLQRQQQNQMRLSCLQKQQLCVSVWWHFLVKWSLLQ